LGDGRRFYYGERCTAKTRRAGEPGFVRLVTLADELPREEVGHEPHAPLADAGSAKDPEGLGAARRRAHQDVPTQIQMGELTLVSMLESCNTSSIRTYPSDWSPQLASVSITG
jgi:hypothetical protein